VSIEFIKGLTQLSGPSGYEGDVSNFIKEKLASVGEITTDRIGNIVCRIEGSDPGAPHLLFAAHQDEVAFMVSDITAGGFLRFIGIGGWNPITLPSSPVEVISESGERHYGIIGQLPPHFIPKGEPPKVPTIDELFIDIGARSREEAEELYQVGIGSIIIPYAPFKYNPKGEVLFSKAFDDRIGVAALIELGHLVKEKGVAATLSLAFTVQEEVGVRGAKVLAQSIEADAAIVVEGAPADDVPSNIGSPQTVLGKGAHLRIFDTSHIGHPGLFRLARDIARREKIEVQEAVRKGGGTDAREIALAKGGIPTIVCGVGVRYAHSHNSLISLSDYRNLVKLLFAVSRDMTKLE